MAGLFAFKKYAMRAAAHRRLSADAERNGPARPGREDPWPAAPGALERPVLSYPGEMLSR
jgi:hypothetical protein